MKVFVLVIYETADFDGPSFVAGVFSTSEKARQAWQKYKDNYVCYEIVEEEIIK